MTLSSLNAEHGWNISMRRMEWARVFRREMVCSWLEDMVLIVGLSLRILVSWEVIMVGSFVRNTCSYLLQLGCACSVCLIIVFYFESNRGIFSETRCHDRGHLWSYEGWRWLIYVKLFILFKIFNFWLSLLFIINVCLKIALSFELVISLV